MKRITIDFETRSVVPLKKCGMHLYSKDVSTSIMCLAVKPDDTQTRIWIADHIKKKLGPMARQFNLLTTPEVTQLAVSSDVIEAHNAGFEMTIWENVCYKRMGWPYIPINKWRCSAAKAAASALPRSLDGAARAIGLPIQKNTKGHRIMLKLSKPRTPTKNNPSKWFTDPQDLFDLCLYCIQDVDASHALSARLPDLTPLEQMLWQLDYVINARGVYVDKTTAQKALMLTQEYADELLAEFREITDGKVESPAQLVKFLEWLADQKCDLPNLQRPTVEDALAAFPPGPVRRTLEIRHALSMSSTRKYQTLLNRIGEDQRLRGILLYHGAATGRWSGIGFQPQNLPRGEIKDVNFAVAAIRSKSLPLLKTIYENPMKALSAAIRPMLCAPTGHMLVCVDFSSIEGRVLAWLAREEWVLEAYRAGKDMYVVTAAALLRIRESQITPELRQKIGKPAELACGYGGGVNAVRHFGGGDGMTDDEVMEKFVKPWRKTHRKTVSFWKGIESAAWDVVTHRAKNRYYNGIGFILNNGFLKCRLPSGRYLSYYDPQIKPWLTPWGETRDTLTYMGVDSFTRKWTRIATHGAKLTENIDQAVSRDILAEALLRVESAGYRVVLTVHDEIIAEVPNGNGSLKHFEQTMSAAPKWAEHLPIEAHGWTGKRYRKE